MARDSELVSGGVAYADGGGPLCSSSKFLCTGDNRSLDWHSDPSGTTYHFPRMTVDYDLDGTIDLVG